jgi:transposase InsO family protein
VACGFLGVSTSGYYEWASRPPSVRSTADVALTATIRQVHRDSRGTYGAPRVLAELRLGLGVHVGKKRVARLMRLDGPGFRIDASAAAGSRTPRRMKIS